MVPPKAKEKKSRAGSPINTFCIDEKEREKKQRQKRDRCRKSVEKDKKKKEKEVDNKTKQRWKRAAVLMTSALSIAIHFFVFFFVSFILAVYYLNDRKTSRRKAAVVWCKILPSYPAVFQGNHYNKNVVYNRRVLLSTFNLEIWRGVTKISFRIFHHIIFLF